MKLPARAVQKFFVKYRNYLPFVIVLVGMLAAVYILFMPKTAGREVTVSKLEQLSSCPEATKFDCYSGYFKNRALQTDPKTSLAEMKQQYDNGDAYVIAQCHQLAHWVGHGGFKKYQSLAKAYTNGDTFCWSGYYHGVTEEAVGAMGGERIKKEANLICKELADTKRYSFEHYNCVHGLGHGFMAVDSYNLFTSLKTCDLLTDSWEKTSCYGGVFMENVMVVVRQDGKSDYLKPDQPMYPCTAVEEVYKHQCYLMQTSYALQQNGYDFAKGFLLCRDVADAGYTTTCYQSLGRDASGSTVSDITKTKANCDKALDALGVENCMLGAVRDFVSYYHSDIKAREFCGVFEPTVAQRCLAEVDSYYATFR